jgi:hypothetical protein
MMRAKESGHGENQASNAPADKDGAKMVGIELHGGSSTYIAVNCEIGNPVFMILISTRPEGAGNIPTNPTILPFSLIFTPVTE